MKSDIPALTLLCGNGIKRLSKIWMRAHFKTNGVWCSGNILALGASDLGFESQHPDHRREVPSLSF